MIYEKQVELDLLVNFIKFIRPSFQDCVSRSSYNHMGATLTDTILQAGLNYKKVVQPRVIGLKTKYPHYNTTSDFLMLIENHTLSNLINWNNTEKLCRLENIALLLLKEKIETEYELSCWLNQQQNCTKLYNIKGIGPKTVDYLKMLTGIPSIPIDRHLFKFIELAGIKVSGYEHASALYKEASYILGISLDYLDYNIWTLMSSIKN